MFENCKELPEQIIIERSVLYFWAEDFQAEFENRQKRWKKRIQENKHKVRNQSSKVTQQMKPEPAATTGSELKVAAKGKTGDAPKRRLEERLQTKDDDGSEEDSKFPPSNLLCACPGCKKVAIYSPRKPI